MIMKMNLDMTMKITVIFLNLILSLCWSVHANSNRLVEAKQDGSILLNQKPAGQQMILPGFVTHVSSDAGVTLNKLPLSLIKKDKTSWTFGANGVEIHFTVIEKSRYTTFSITNVVDTAERRVMKLDFPVGTNKNVMAIPLDYMTDKKVHRGNNSYIHFNHLWGRDGTEPLGSFALALTKNEEDADETLLHIWAEETLPHPKLDRPWTVETARAWLKDWQDRFVDQSTMVIQPKNPDQLYRLTDKAKSIGMKKVYLHTDSWRGEYWPVQNSFLHVNRRLFPEGESDFKKYGQYCRSKGLNLAIHIVSCSIGFYDPDYAQPKLDERLAGWATGELARPIGPNATTIEFKPTEGSLYPRNVGRQWAGPNTRYPFMDINMIKVGDELIVVGEFTKTDGDVWILKDCRRGANRTSQISHDVGTKIKGMVRPYAQAFAADPRTSLVDDVARQYSEFCNRIGITHMEADGQEIHLTVPWGTNKFVWKVYENLDHPVTSNTSSGGPLKYQIEYWFHSSQDIWNNHTTGGVAGGDGVPLYLSHKHRPATGPYEILLKPTQRLGLGGRTFNFIRPKPMFGIAEKALASHGLSDMISENFLKWHDAAERIKPDQIETINAWFSSKFRSPFHEASNQMATDVLVRPEMVDGDLALTPLSMMSRPAGELNWGWGQEYGPLIPRQYLKTGDQQQLNNPYHDQTPEVLVRVMHRLGEKSSESLQTKKSEVSATGETSNIVDSYNHGAGHGDTAHPLSRAHHIWATGALEQGMAAAGVIAARKTFELSDLKDLDYAALVFHADDSLKVYFNGKKLFSGGAYNMIQMLDVTDKVKTGINAAGFEVLNEGWVGCLTAAVVLSIKGKLQIFPSNKSWKASKIYPEGWARADFDDSKWNRVVELGKFGEMDWERLPVQQAISLTNLMPELKSIKKHGTHQITKKGKVLHMELENKGDQVLKLGEKLPQWRTSASMDGSRGIGMRVTGDGSGAMLVVNVEGRGQRDYVVKLDFTGPRDIEIPCGMVAWGDPNWGWRNRTGKISYVSIQGIKMGLGIVPPKTKVKVKVENLRILKEHDATLINPTIHLSKGSLNIKGKVSSDHYLWYTGGEYIGVYDLNWNKVQDLAVVKHDFVATHGEQTFAVSDDSSAKGAWLECQLMVKDQPMKLRKK